jgi:hypothetical protein
MPLFGQFRPFLLLLLLYFSSQIQLGLGLIPRFRLSNSIEILATHLLLNIKNIYKKIIQN